MAEQTKDEHAPMPVDQGLIRPADLRKQAEDLHGQVNYYRFASAMLTAGATSGVLLLTGVLHLPDEYYTGGHATARKNFVEAATTLLPPFLFAGGLYCAVTESSRRRRAERLEGMAVQLQESVGGDPGIFTAADFARSRIVVNRVLGEVLADKGVDLQQLQQQAALSPPAQDRPNPS